MKTKKHKALLKGVAVRHDDVMAKMLRGDRAFAQAYFDEALKSRFQEPELFLVTLRHLAEARGMAKVAKAAGLQRESLYRALSPSGNPTFKTLLAVLSALDVRMELRAA
jgi:probable addiction module antidote protein